MKSAQDIVHQVLQRIDILPNRLPLYSNQTGQLYCGDDEVREYLIRQICEPVKWDVILQEVVEAFSHGYFEAIYEVGPGKNLKTMLGKMDRRIIRNTNCISS